MDETGKVSAPFTDDQVASLNAFQDSGTMHPFTCNRPWCEGVLKAEADGLWCAAQYCSYVQFWAHGWMADWSWKKMVFSD